ncbi:MAG: FtsQ-type POTRA domain-containing protein [Ignavibacteria bacterium]|jgi:cell division septal protein FtsQ|nr:FtsQ-type POTRA domain-containing protein [Ignavibacteria bacterium]
MQKKDKIIGITLFSVLTCILVFLSFFQGKKNSSDSIQKVIVDGNQLLSKDDYLRITGLDVLSINDSLTLRTVKERFENHPYIQSITLELKADRTVEVSVIEKEIQAVVNIETKNFLISKKYEVINILPNTQVVDYPVITNSSLTNLSVNKICDSTDIKSAFKMIYATKQIDSNFSRMISEINLRNGKEAVIYLTGLNPVVLIGKNEEVKKIYVLYELLKQNNKTVSMVRSSSYIDLRYSENLFLGQRQLTGI